MLPIVDKPLIQYAVEEAAAAGITEMIFITGRGKRSIEDHFDKAYELEAELAAHGKDRLLEEVRNLLPRNIHYSYVRQVDALGLGHAVLCARPLVNDEPFAVLLADDLIDAQTPVLKQMVDRFNGQSILGLQNVAREDTSQYGIVKAAEANVPVEINGHRRKAPPRCRAVYAGRRRSLCANATHLSSPADRSTRQRRGNPIDRRHRQPHE